MGITAGMPDGVPFGISWRARNNGAATGADSVGGDGAGAAAGAGSTAAGAAGELSWAAEGFGSIEELALVDEKEIAGIEGFDEDTARELQERAKEYLAAQEAELDAKRTELGVADELKEVPGVTTKMMVALGENGVKTVEDLAGCATDDLTGWTERKDGESKHEPGYLEGFGILREDAEALIMQARLKAGWVTEAELAPPPAEAAEAPAEAPQA